MQTKEAISCGFPWFRYETSAVMNYTFGCRINNSMHVICTNQARLRAESSQFICCKLVTSPKLRLWRGNANRERRKASLSQEVLHVCCNLPFTFHSPISEESLLWDLFHFTLLQICMFVPCLPDCSKETNERRNEIREISFILPCRLESNVKRQEGVQIVMTNVSDSL